MEERVLAEDDAQAVDVLELAQELAKGPLQVVGDRRVHGQRDLLAGVRGGAGEQLAADLEADGGQRLDAARALAVRALAAQGALQARPRALAGQLHEADLAHRQQLGAGGVAEELLREGVVNLAPVGRVFHVDEVDDDDAAEVAQPQLADDLAARLEVEGEDGLLQRLSADELAGIDIDGHQGLGLVDDQVAAGLQPHLRAQGLLELAVDAEGAHEIGGLPVQLDALDEGGLGLLQEVENLLEALLVVDPDLRHRVRVHVADRAQDRAQLAVDEARRAGGVAGGLDPLPELYEVVPVGRELVRAPVLAGGADDPAAGSGEALDDLLQPLPLVGLGDAPRDADLADVRQVHQKAAGQADVGGEARPLGADGVLHHLHQHLLPEPQQVGDVRARRVQAQTLAVAGEEDVGEVVEDAAGLADVEEGVAIQPDVDEGRLHAGQHPRHTALVEVADHRRGPVALRLVGHEAGVLDQGDAGLEGVDGEEEDGARHWLTTRRRHTAWTMPSAAQVEISDDPP